MKHSDVSQPVALGDRFNEATRRIENQNFS
jgi:hypothetical protein